VAYYQVQRGNRRGAYKMLLRSVQWLNILPDACQGVDVAALRDDVAALRAAIEGLPEDADLTPLEAYLKPVPLVE
jgi:predicted metal-dependent hydrolase